jgi:hypothetical protein
VLGYRAALYFGAGLALVAVIVDMIFVRVMKDIREGWSDPTDQEADRGMGFHEGISTGVEGARG